MVHSFKAVKVTEKVYWVGAIDWRLRNFHGYATHRGSTYNAFLILSDKITLIDTVKAPFKEEMLSRIASIVDPKNIGIIVSNHSEMDHTGCLHSVAREVDPERIYASVMGQKALAAHFHSDREIIAVKDGDEIDLGNMKLLVAETRMLHWPDSMFTFLKEEGILFSQDGFGMHLASTERFADELPEWLLEHEAAKYFANILLPYAGMVGKVMEKLDGLNLSVKMIAPDHGPVWRERLDWIMNLYRGWVEQKPVKRAAVVYDTMWNSTDLMARVIADGLLAEGVNTKLLPLDGSDRSDVATEVMNSGALIVGAPTLNSNLFPSMVDALTYLKGLKPKNLIGACFSSYGWSGEAARQLENYLNEMKIEKVGETINIQYVPAGEDLERCFELGREVGRSLVERCRE